MAPSNSANNGHHPFDALSVSALREKLRHTHPGIRADAACALGDRLRMHLVDTLDSQIQSNLAELLDDAHALVRFEAAMALAELHDDRALPVLIESLKRPSVRLDAMRAVGTLRNPTATHALRPWLHKWFAPWADKLQAAAALCALGDNEGRDYLKKKLFSRKRAERAAAIHFVGESAHPDANDLLQNILWDTNDPMQDVAARTLGHYTKTEELLDKILKTTPEALKQEILDAHKQAS